MDRRVLLRGALSMPLLPLGSGVGMRRPAAAPAPAWCDLARAAAVAATPADVLPAPFTAPLPIPPERDGAQVDLLGAPADVRVLPGGPTRMLTYDGAFPGPTIVAAPGSETVVRLVNGHDDGLVLHLHGGHTAAEHDGHPLDLITPGEAREYRYPNRQRPATLWYHDHAMMATAPNVFRGLAGLYLIRDAAEVDLGLPVGGPADIPLVLTDRTFDGDGQLVYPDGARDGVVGDVVLVNGAVTPIGRVPAGRVRLRIVNASNARPYRLVRTDGEPLLQIAGDGGLLSAPLHRRAVELWPSERAEVLLDLPAGADVVLADEVQFRDGVVRLVADGAAPPPPGPLRLPPAGDLGEPAVVRDLTLDRDPATGTWLLAGHPFDAAAVDAVCRMDEVERWRLVNRAPGAHPMHLHLSAFLVRARRSAGGAAHPLEEGDVGWKDTVVVRPGQTVELDVAFSDFPGTFVYHCHVLEHEDHAMMSQFRVLPVGRVAGADRLGTAVAASRRLHPDGAPAVVVATGEGFADALAAGPVAAALGGPVLLTTGASLPTSVADEIRRLGPARVIVAGGPAAVPDAVLADLAALAPTERIAGATATATAAALSAAAFDRADEVWLASADGFADALAAGAAAAAGGVPLLLARRDALPAETAAELDRLGASRVVLVGGEAALGPAVASAVAAAGRAVERLAGADRFATAAAVANRTHPGGAGVVVVASGMAWPDAVVAAPLAAAEGAPVLLVGDALPPATAAAIGALGPDRLLVLGGEAAVPAAAELAAADLLAG